MMKTLRDYITETETWVDNPAQGDDFDIELAPDELLESYVVEVMEDGIVIAGDDRVVSLLESFGHTTEEIRRYGAVGNSPGMGHTLEEEEEELEEEIEDVPTEPAESKMEEMYLARVMELAGVADHKFDKQDDVYKEDQAADVVAQKEIADRITEPMPGVHEEEELDDDLDEAEYQGRKVELNKPKRGGSKKFYVYVKDPKSGNVRKISFGDPNMKIKKSNPARRKSFRARHRCDNPGPKTSARYWACRSW